MARQFKGDDLQNLIQIIISHPHGVSIEDLLSIINEKISKRTLQYRLAYLVKKGDLKRIGVGRSSKYYSRTLLEIKEEQEGYEVPQIQSFPLSSQARVLKKLMTVPVQQRYYVSYRREFLNAYEPNQTFYLSEKIRKKLLKLGSGVEKGRPPGTYAKKIYQRFLIDFSWNSSRLEGNTYSLLETKKLLAAGEEIHGKQREETRMILNHKEAIEFIVDMAEEIAINRYTILNLHELLSHSLLLDPHACGSLRTIPVNIGKSVYLPIEMPQLIAEYFQILIHKAAEIKNPFEQSFFLMVQLPYLQPFLDVNKRVSRLAGNLPFIRENLCPVSFVDVPESDYIQGLLAIYELNRIELFRDVFVWAYERSASRYAATLGTIGQPDPFRMRYRDLIHQAVQEVIHKKLNKEEASYFISKFAEDTVSSRDQPQFVEVVDIEMNSLHEGNFARFRIRPSEFFAWQKLWK